MGTTWVAKLARPHPAANPAAITELISARLEALEQQLSTYRATSELSRFNASRATDWMPVSADLAEVAVRSRRVSELTGGAFDPTVAPLLQLWGFGPAGRTGAVPSAAEISAALTVVGWRQLESKLQPPALRKSNAALAADFSSLAKGFAADAVSTQLAALGSSNHFVQIGGDIRTRGRAADQAGWRVGLEAPATGAALAAVVALADAAVSTSGNYRNVVVLGGERFGHILDPRTGRPVAGSLVAVSVIAADGATSSAWATALFVLGTDAGMTTAERENLAALFSVREGAGLVQRETKAFAKLRAPDRALPR